MFKVVHCKKEKFDIYIGRPSIWGNVFSHKERALAKFKTNTRTESLFKYQEWVLNQPEFVKQIKKELKNKILGCWCSPKSCHGDILLAIANDLPLPFSKQPSQPDLFT